jgi:formate--tetrahydrofolate ligase
MSIPSDIAIAQAATLKPITEVAATIGLAPDDLDQYGRYKAKVPLELTTRPAKGKLVLVTAINPTAAAEGKTTT